MAKKKYVVKVCDGSSSVYFTFKSGVNATTFADICSDHLNKADRLYYDVAVTIKITAEETEETEEETADETDEATEEDE